MFFYIVMSLRFVENLLELEVNLEREGEIWAMLPSEREAL